MRTIWLASFPKSGNTWFRMLVANLSAVDGKPADINNLPQRGGIASARAQFDDITLIDSGLLTPDEVDCLRPRVYEELASGTQDDEYDEPYATAPVRFVKVHDAYTLTSLGEPLLAGRRGADGAIVIVRDPRDIVPSFAHHLGTSIDKTIDFMNGTCLPFGAKPDRQYDQFRQKLCGWSGHIASWLDQTELAVHLLRYEDMHADAATALARALAFAGYPATTDQIAQAATLANFAQLRQQEREMGFRERSGIGEGRVFFRRGQSGAWREELTATQVARIEAEHAPMMRRLGYELSGDAGLVQTESGDAA